MKKFLVIIFLLIFSLTACGVSNAQSYEFIESFDSKIDIKEDGTMFVKETIVYNFPEARHGIYRQIPLIKTNEDGKKYVLTASNVNVRSDLDIPYPYEDQSTREEIYLKIGDPDATIIGKKTYIIRYKISGALTYFKDHDELYWNVSGNEWEVPINKITTTITLPKQLASNSIKTVCYTGSYSSSDSSCTSQVSGNSVTITSNSSFFSGEGLTVAVSFPKDIVAYLEPTEFKKTLGEQIMEILYFVGFAFWYVILPVGVFIYAYNKKKKQPEEKKVVAAWFDPPKAESGRDLTAGEVGILYDRKGDIRDITASLIQLAQKGFIKIKVDEIGTFFKKEDFKLILLKDFNDSSLLEYEESLLKAIFKNEDNEVSVQSLGKKSAFSSDIQKVYKHISKRLVDDGLYENDPIKTKEKWYIGLLPSFFFFNPLLIAAIFYGANSAKRTKLGATAWATVESLKNFVKSQTNQLEFQAKNQMFFEKLLPYAISLGVEKIWVERFKDLNITAPEWLESSDLNTLNYMYFMNSFNSSFSNAVSISTSRSSSGFSSGFSGGFSGGGGGGGGGGSW